MQNEGYSANGRRLVKTSVPGIYKRGGRYVVIVRDPSGRPRKHAAATMKEARATKAALRLTRSFGGYVRSVDYGTNGGGGTADLVLRIPVGSVQEARPLLVVERHRKTSQAVNAHTAFFTDFEFQATAALSGVDLLFQFGQTRFQFLIRRFGHSDLNDDGPGNHNGLEERGHPLAALRAGDGS